MPRKIDSGKYYHGTPCRRAGHTLRDKRANRCVECGREHNRKAHRKRLEKKATRPRPDHCECCLAPAVTPLHFDHCHDSDQFRGWICNSCNTSIGKLGDNIEGVEKALAYLRRSVL